MSDEGRTLPPFPVHDEVLDALEHALGGVMGFNEAGKRVIEGADYSLNQLLYFYSGYDDSRSVLIDSHFNGMLGDSELWLHPDQIYGERCVIRALIAEIRRLRGDEG